MAVFSWRVSILQRPHLGEEQPDRSRHDEGPMLSDPAVRNIPRAMP